MSRYIAASLFNPRQKCCNITWSGIDKLGPDCSTKRIWPRQLLWIPYHSVGNQESPYAEIQHGIVERMRDKIYLVVLSTPRLRSRWCGCTIVSLYPEGRKETTSTWEFPASCLRLKDMSTIAQILADGDTGFHFQNQRKTVLEPWLWSQGEVRNQELKWVSPKAVVRRTPPWSRQILNSLKLHLNRVRKYKRNFKTKIRG